MWVIHPFIQTSLESVCLYGPQMLLGEYFYIQLVIHNTAAMMVDNFSVGQCWTSSSSQGSSSWSFFCFVFFSFFFLFSIIYSFVLGASFHLCDLMFPMVHLHYQSPTTRFPPMLTSHVTNNKHLWIDYLPPLIYIFSSQCLLNCCLYCSDFTTET